MGLLQYLITSLNALMLIHPKYKSYVVYHTIKMFSNIVVVIKKWIAAFSNQEYDEHLKAAEFVSLEVCKEYRRQDDIKKKQILTIILFHQIFMVSSVTHSRIA